VTAAKIKALYSRSRYLRSGVTGLLAGFVSSFVLATTLESIPVAVLLGSVIGIAYVVAFRNLQRLYIDSAAAAFRIPLWAFVSVVVVPLISRQQPRDRRGNENHATGVSCMGGVWRRTRLGCEGAKQDSSLVAWS
jgi:hypothetical protein